MSKYKFNSQIKLLNKFEADGSTDLIKNEPMFFNCSLDFAYNNSYSITRKFIDALPSGWENSVFDSRVHMLMPGWFPCIPGYHHDDVARNETGQPDYDNLKYKSEHIIGLVNSSVCPTIFAIGEVELAKVEDGIVYKTWHKEIEKQLKESKLTEVEAPDKQLVYFDYQAFHSGQRALKSGWRWFGRVSKNTDRINNITNEIRRQVQVYLEFPMEGW